MGEIRVGRPVEGAPAEFENEFQRRIYDLLAQTNTPFLRVENDPAVTMEDCRAIDAAFGVETIKTVFLTNRQQTKFYLLAMPAEKPFVTRHFGAALGVPRVSFAGGGLLETMLGTPHGAATPLSVANDAQGVVEMVVDAELCRREKVVCPDGTLHGFICLRTADLLQSVLPAAHHVPTIASLTGE